jgi:CRP-like cAMP-binding protein
MYERYSQLCTYVYVKFYLTRFSYEARRVVLKLGHRPEAFYIVLSGFVFANVEEVCPSTGKTFMKTVKEMGPGDTFGVSFILVILFFLYKCSKLFFP